MNYLAHLTLSQFSPPLQVGNFLADHVKGRAALAALPPGIRRGVLMHRALDRATDAHPAVLALCRRVARRHGRYAGVVVDIALDHTLYCNWHRFGIGGYADFCEEVYTRLRAAVSILPATYHERIRVMTEGRWLTAYTDLEGMQGVYRRLRKRLSRPEQLNRIGDLFPDFGNEFNHVLNTLFPALIALARTYVDPPRL